MKGIMLFVLVFLTSALGFSNQGDVKVLIQNDILKAVGATVIDTDKKSDLSVAILTDEQREHVHEISHDYGRCGGYELLNDNSILSTDTLFENINRLNKLNEEYVQPLSAVSMPLTYNQSIDYAVKQVSTANVQTYIEWFSSYPTRHHRSEHKNQHVMDAMDYIRGLIGASVLYANVEMVQHSRTHQNSLRVRILGSERPNEIVVLGGHFDSISGWSSGNHAPGADDNASGSSCLLEALRVILGTGVQPKRTIEFYWYAAEEVGLVGSAEIAQAYRGANADVIGALQLDMTLFPGDGLFSLGSMTDFTSSWLRQMLVDLNGLYIGANIIESQCGYGCSDHASWYRAGYPTLMPFEATMESMNGLIHTRNDLPNSQTSFEHAAMFSKIAVAFALELANSNARQPY